MKRIGIVLLIGFIAFNLTGCLSTSSIFDFDDDELNAYYENEIRKGTEEKLAAKEAEKNTGSKTSSTTPAKKTETTDQKVERAKTLAKSGKIEDLETASALMTEARKAEPWNVEYDDLDYEIVEKLYAAKVKEAERLYNSGTNADLDKAGKLVDEVLDKRPGNSEARNLRVKISTKQAHIVGEQVAIDLNIQDAKDYIKSNSPELALKRLEKVLASDPNNAEAKTLVADAKTLQAKNLAMDKGHLDEAEKILNEALKDLPSHSGAKKLLAEVKDLKKKAESSPFKVGSVYKLSSYTENGKSVPSRMKPGHKLTFTSKSSVEENSQIFSTYRKYGFHVDTASRSIIFNNTDPHNVMYTKATYSADLKTIIFCGIDIDGKLDGSVYVFTLSN
ncbi:MAG: tetratricopeptide repeat protein [Treponema sp.]|nr:tetratricopeptide repeat protein [Treponema sp.]MBP5753033.1 tetratricopeptide repeat protein [Treponema sp.]